MVFVEWDGSVPFVTLPMLSTGAAQSACSGGYIWSILRA
jgi:hypothetical protein